MSAHRKKAKRTTKITLDLIYDHGIKRINKVSKTKSSLVLIARYYFPSTSLVQRSASTSSTHQERYHALFFFLVVSDLNSFFFISLLKIARLNPSNLYTPWTKLLTLTTATTHCTLRSSDILMSFYGLQRHLMAPVQNSLFKTVRSWMFDPSIGQWG
jgi:hypothetical protein